MKLTPLPSLGIGENRARIELTENDMHELYLDLPNGKHIKLSLYGGSNTKGDREYHLYITPDMHGLHKGKQPQINAVYKFTGWPHDHELSSWVIYHKPAACIELVMEV